MKMTATLNNHKFTIGEHRKVNYEFWAHNELDILAVHKMIKDTEDGFVYMRSDYDRIGYRTEVYLKDNYNLKKPFEEMLKEINLTDFEHIKLKKINEINI